MLKYLFLLMGFLGSSSIVYANCEIDSDLANKSCSNEFFSPKNIKQLNEYLQYGKFKDGKLLNLELDFDIKDREINIATWCDVKIKRGVSLKSSMNGICIKGANVILKGENQLSSDKKSPIIIGAGRSIILRRSHLQTQGVITLDTKNFNPFDGEILISKDSILKADRINISTPSSLIINKDSSLRSAENILNGGNCEIGDYDDSENDEDRDHGRSCKRFSPKFQYSGKCANNPLPTNIKILSSVNGQDSLNKNYSLENRPASTEVRWRFDQEAINVGINSSKYFLFPGRHLVESIVVDQSGYFRKIGTYQNISPNKFNKGQTAIFQFSGLKRSPSKVTALMGLRKFTLLRSQQNPELYSGEIPADSAGNKLMAIPEFGYRGSFNLIVLPAISNPDAYIGQSVDQLSTLLDSVTSTNQAYLNSKASLQSLLEELKTKITLFPESDKQKIAEYLQANIFADLQGITSFKQIKERPSTLFGLLISSAYASNDIPLDFISISASDMRKIALISVTLIGASWAAWLGIEGLTKLSGLWKLGAAVAAAAGIIALITRVVNAQDTIEDVHNIDQNTLHLKRPNQINSDQVATFSVWGQAVPLDSIAPTSPLISQSINAKNNVNFELDRINAQLSSANSTLSLLGFSSQVEQLPLLSFPQTRFPTILSANYITNVQLISSEDGQASIQNYSKNGNNLLITFNTSRTQNARLRVTFVNADLGINRNIDTDIVISVTPKAVISYTKNNLVVNYTSSEPEIPGTIFYWNFGDNPIPVRTTSRSLSHTYLYPGYYYVSVVSIDSLGNEVEARTEVSVSSAPPPPPPPPEPPTQLEKIWFTQQSAFTQVTSVVLASPPAVGATYNWDFGDGQKEISYDGTISHWYSTSGRYILSVSVGSSIVSTVVDVFFPTLEILSQPLSIVPYGKSWDYKLMCNIGERIMMDTTVINFKTGVQIGSENVFTCSGVGQTGIGINTNQTLHTITCTPKALSCPYSFGLTIYPTFYCAVIEDGVIYQSNWIIGIAHTIDYEIPGGCNPEP